MMTLHRRAAETAPNDVHISLREDIKVVCALVSRHHLLAPSAWTRARTLDLLSRPDRLGPGSLTSPSRVTWHFKAWFSTFMPLWFPHSVGCVILVLLCRPQSAQALGLR